MLFKCLLDFLNMHATFLSLVNHIKRSFKVLVAYCVLFTLFLCLPLQVELLKSSSQQSFKNRSQSPVKYKYSVTPQSSKKFPSANQDLKAQHRSSQNQTKGNNFSFIFLAHLCLCSVNS